MRLELWLIGSQTGARELDWDLPYNFAPSNSLNRRARHVPPQKRSLDHVRSASLGLPGLHGASDPEDAQYRRNGKAGGTLFKRLCAIADLRPLADVVLYRPLHALPRLALERLAAARRRTDARRASQEDRRPQRAGRQNAHDARPRRPENAWDYGRLRDRRACRRMPV